jgi:hypothetical protein
VFLAVITCVGLVPVFKKNRFVLFVSLSCPVYSVRGTPPVHVAVTYVALSITTDVALIPMNITLAVYPVVKKSVPVSTILVGVFDKEVIYGFPTEVCL